MYGVPRCMCRIVPSVFADASRNRGESSPMRDTLRGWSWFSKYSEFQPLPIPSCQRTTFFLYSTHGQSNTSKRPFGPWSSPTCSNWNTCLLYTSDAADEEDSVDLGGRRIIKK